APTRADALGSCFCSLTPPFVWGCAPTLIMGCVHDSRAWERAKSGTFAESSWNSLALQLCGRFYECRERRPSGLSDAPPRYGRERHAPRFIETAHRRGFRFIAETQRIGAADPAARGASADVDALRSPRKHPFVGRDEELQFLATRFAMAQAGERQIVFITGPA